MKNSILKFVVPVMLLSFITLSVSAQTKSSSSSSSKSANVAKNNQDYTNWQTKISTFKTKYAKNADAQDDIKTITGDLAAYKKAISSYSSAKAANLSDAGDAVKSAKEQLNTDYTAAKTKLAPAKKPAASPKTN